MLIIAAYIVTSVVYGTEVILEYVDIKKSAVLRLSLWSVRPIFWLVRLALWPVRRTLMPRWADVENAVHVFHERCRNLANEKEAKERLWIFLARLEQMDPKGAAAFAWKSGITMQDHAKTEAVDIAGFKYDKHLKEIERAHKRQKRDFKGHLQAHLQNDIQRPDDAADELIMAAEESLPLHTFPELWIASCRWRACVPSPRLSLACEADDWLSSRMIWHVSLIGIALAAFLGLCELSRLTVASCFADAST